MASKSNKRCRGVRKLREIMEGYADVPYSAPECLYVICTWADSDKLDRYARAGFPINKVKRAPYELSTLIHCIQLEVPDAFYQKLIALGANVDDTDRDGWSALHYGCLDGEVEKIRMLIENGANVNATDCWGGTPLCTICRSSLLDTPERIRIVRMLLEAGADRYARDADSYTARRYAEEGGHPRELLELFETVWPVPLPDVKKAE